MTISKSKRVKLPAPNDSDALRCMSDEEAREVDAAWFVSEEYQILNEKRKKLITAIALKSGSYSPLEKEREYL